MKMHASIASFYFDWETVNDYDARKTIVLFLNGGGAIEHAGSRIAAASARHVAAKVSTLQYIDVLAPAGVDVPEAFGAKKIDIENFEPDEHRWFKVYADLISPSYRALSMPLLVTPTESGVFRYLVEEGSDGEIVADCWKTVLYEFGLGMLSNLVESVSALPVQKTGSLTAGTKRLTNCRKNALII